MDTAATYLNSWSRVAAQIFLSDTFNIQATTTWKFDSENGTLQRNESSIIEPIIKAFAIVLEKRDRFDTHGTNESLLDDTITEKHDSRYQFDLHVISTKCKKCENDIPFNITIIY